MTVAAQGDYGKPRPALVVQSDLFAETGSVTLVLISSTLAEIPLLRLPLAPSAENNLTKPSQIMIDKLVTVPRSRVGPVFGRVDDAVMVEVNRALLVFLGMA